MILIVELMYIFLLSKAKRILSNEKFLITIAMSFRLLLDALLDDSFTDASLSDDTKVSSLWKGERGGGRRCKLTSTWCLLNNANKFTLCWEDNF